ncbi:MAG: ribosome biogenesis GTPase Der [Spirochaetales bacterium]|nr:ribosome biogenesis GTPase Der [Spirochaetales bacterium]
MLNSILQNGWKQRLNLKPIKNSLPRIAVIGKPNVGKSTLFNRLLGRRRSITDPTPGVTRDSLEEMIEINGKPYVLVDTGGYSQNEEGFNKIVTQKSLSTAQAADMILLLLDVHDIDANDLHFLDLLRPYAEKIILVANKVDNDQQESNVWNLYQYGIEKVIGISAAHGRNLIQLKNEITFFLADKGGEAHQESDRIIKIAIMGKPNTGKSTLTNFLMGEEKSIVSDIPGTTRDTIEGHFDYKNYEFQILDTAGIRRKGKVKEDVEYYSVNRAIKTLDEASLVFLMVDSLDEISDQDKKIASLAVKKGRGMILVLNKWDLRGAKPNEFEAVKDKTRFLFPHINFAPILPVSAKTGDGVDALLKASIQVFQQLSKRIETNDLNKKIQLWTENYTLRIKGKSVKIRYGTQVSVNPLKFIFFLNRAQGVRKEYESYMKNRIREDLGFDKVPFSVEFRSNS